MNIIRKRSIIVSFVLIFLLAFSVQSIAANWFVDTTLTTGSNNGTSTDDAFQSVKTALESTGYSAGDKVWFRRASSFSSASDHITVTEDGDKTSPIYFIGWPRASHAISSSDWVSGETEVTVDDADMDREKHQGRYVTGPDGHIYLITRVVDSDTIIIDRGYIGTTAFNSGATISADEDYATAQAIDDSGWTIKISTWTADADDLPKIDFEATDYYFYLNNSMYVNFSNFEFSRGTGSGKQLVWCGYNSDVNIFTGCLFKSSDNNSIFYGAQSGFVYLRRCIIEGSGSGGSQRGVHNGNTHLEDCAIYNCGDYGIYNLYALYNNPFLKNVNIGVEIANGDYDIATSQIQGIDVKLGGINGYFSRELYGANAISYITKFENYQKILGYHFAYLGCGEMYSASVTAGSGDPYKRTNGADKIASIRLNYDSAYCPVQKYMADLVFDHAISADTSSKSYRYYVQLKDISSLTSDELYIECYYVSAYTGEAKYKLSTVFSDESVSLRTGADDWSQYIEVTGIQPAVESVVHLRVRVTGYDADGYLYIDPLPYIY